MTGRQSTKPQQVSPSVWYYENGRHLEFYVLAEKEWFLGDHTLRFDVPLDMLEASIARAPRKGTK